MDLPTSSTAHRSSPTSEVHDVGTRLFRWHVVNNGGRDFYAHLEWRNPEHGDSLSDLTRGGSSFEQMLSEVDPRTHYFTFFVWDDSFEAYLAARELAVRSGFSVGWDLNAEHEALPTLAALHRRAHLH